MPWVQIRAVARNGIVRDEVIDGHAPEGPKEEGRVTKADAVNRLSGHFILCGYGRVGHTVARELQAAAWRAAGAPVELKLYPAVGHIDVVAAMSGLLSGRAPTRADVLAYLATR